MVDEDTRLEELVVEDEAVFDVKELLVVGVVVIETFAVWTELVIAAIAKIATNTITAILTMSISSEFSRRAKRRIFVLILLFVGF